MDRVRHVLLGLCLVSSMTIAEEIETPDLEFLEFLGEWQEEGEQWLDEQDALDEHPEKAEVEDE